MEKPRSMSETETCAAVVLDGSLTASENCAAKATLPGKPVNVGRGMAMYGGLMYSICRMSVDEPRGDARDTRSHR